MQRRDPEVDRHGDTQRHRDQTERETGINHTQTDRHMPEPVTERHGDTGQGDTGRQSQGETERQAAVGGLPGVVPATFHGTQTSAVFVSLSPPTSPEVNPASVPSCLFPWEHRHPLPTHPAPTHSFKQWAAVSTHCGCTRTPPHWNLL